MSDKIGRNAPCPCGSGKKYKRCCLAADEAGERELAQQEALFDDDLDAVPDDEDFDFDDTGPRIDVADIVRVCFTRGLVQKISDLRSGRGVQVTEWNAPDIPPAVLESIEAEALDELVGEWGNPKAGDPIQVEIIDLETDHDVITIQVFNRGISLISHDSEELLSIGRVCHVLKQAASAGAAAGTNGGAATEPGAAEESSGGVDGQ
jgi:hypothetical protein